MKALYFVTPAVYLLSMRYVGPIGAMAVVAILIVIGYRIWKRYQLVRKLKEYGKRVENIYVLSLYPGDRSVMSRAEMERHWVQLSGNKLGVEVVTIFYQDAENVNEMWEEFEERAKLEIADDRRRRHSRFSEQDRWWYIRYHHNQN